MIFVSSERVMRLPILEIKPWLYLSRLSPFLRYVDLLVEKRIFYPIFLPKFEGVSLALDR